MIPLNKNLQKYFKNTSWMLADKLIKMGLILLVNILVARYLSSNDFGFLSYSISLVSLLAIATHMGLSGLVVKELVSLPHESATILTTVFYIKLFGAVIGFIVLLGINFFTEDIYSLHFLVLLIVSFSIFFKPFEVVDFWFLANVKAKYTAITNVIALIITSMLKVIFVFIGANLLWFAFADFTQALLVSILFIYFFYKKINLPISTLKFSFNKAKYLLGKSWMIMLGSLFAIVYLKIDQIMLKWMIGNKSVGIYAIASSLSEVWYLLPVIIESSLFPKIIEMKEEKTENYNKRLQQLFDFLFSMAFILAIFVTFIANDLVLFLYGQKYEESGAILSIHIWAGVFIFMRALFSKWIILEDVLIFSLITQGLGALTNVLLNFILIPKYGVYGAAVATLLSYAMASYFALYFNQRTRIVFWMMTKAILSPLRYSLFMIKAKLNV